MTIDGLCRDVVREIFSFVPAELRVCGDSFYGNWAVAYRFKSPGESGGGIDLNNLYSATRASAEDVETCRRIVIVPGHDVLDSNYTIYPKWVIARTMSRANIYMDETCGDTKRNAALTAEVLKIIVDNISAGKTLSISAYPNLNYSDEVWRHVEATRPELTRLIDAQAGWLIDRKLNDFVILLAAVSRGAIVQIKSITVRDANVAIDILPAVIKKFPEGIVIENLVIINTEGDILPLVAHSRNAHIIFNDLSRDVDVASMPIAITESLIFFNLPDGILEKMPRLRGLSGYIIQPDKLDGDIFDGRYKCVCIDMRAERYTADWLEEFARRYQLRLWPATSPNRGVYVRRVRPENAGVLDKEGIMELGGWVCFMMH